eukprot:scaffold2799_cov408-Prasinococcus_capsulatus_cf.AAC.21
MSGHAREDSLPLLHLAAPVTHGPGAGAWGVGGRGRRCSFNGQIQSNGGRTCPLNAILLPAPPCASLPLGGPAEAASALGGRRRRCRIGSFPRASGSAAERAAAGWLQLLPAYRASSSNGHMCVGGQLARLTGAVDSIGLAASPAAEGPRPRFWSCGRPIHLRGRANGGFHSAVCDDMYLAYIGEHIILLHAIVQGVHSAIVHNAQPECRVHGPRAFVHSTLPLLLLACCRPHLSALGPDQAT